MASRTNDNPSTLGDRLQQQIAEHASQRLTFAEFMAAALYDPLHGYYATRSAIGSDGDFFTAPHLGADFGELLAEQFVQLWDLLHRPNPFTLVEMGAGQGLLSADILRYVQQHHPEFFASLKYVIVERAAAQIAQQQLRRSPDGAITWCSLEEIAPNSITGCFFSNELVDALPVHRVEIVAGRLQEVYVTIGDRGFSELLGDLSTPRLADYFNLTGITLPAAAYPDRYRTEVNLAALDWISTVADRLQRGYVLTIDYGYSSDRYYSPVKSQGTLQCYTQHRYHNDPYVNVGEQDITAHVDFTALQRQGDRVGLRTVGLTQQALFLMALGLGDRIAALSQSNATDPQTIHTTLRRREALHQLISPYPMGMGDFQVLIQSKGLEAAHRLRGLNAPIA